MGDLGQLLVTFLNPILMIMALVLALSIVSRQRTEVLNVDVLMGGLFSLAVIHTMADPVALSNGGQFDMRGLLIGVAAALFGPRTGLIVMITALTYRIGIGAPGILPGVVHIIVAFGMGMLWHAISPKLHWPEVVQSTVLGLLLSTTLVAVVLAPRDQWGPIFAVIAPYTIICNVLGTILIRFLINTEMSFLDSAAGLRKAAQTDHLTGLLNRRSLESRLSTMSSNPDRWRGVTALYFDIDKFKSINDTYGHAAGDAVLQVVSSRLATTFRSEDVFSRLGGDEFVVILPNLSEVEARSVAERCRRMVADTPVIVGADEIYATISIGAVWTDENANFQRLLTLADKALYSAKANGRNVVAFEGIETQSTAREAAVA